MPVRLREFLLLGLGLGVFAGCDRQTASTPTSASTRPTQSTSTSQGPGSGSVRSDSATKRNDATTAELQDLGGDLPATPPSPDPSSVPTKPAAPVAEPKGPDLTGVDLAGVDAAKTQPDSRKAKEPAKKEPAKKASETKASEEKVYEPIFKDWPAPKFVLVLTGQQLGYIEPCGCTGLANQKGGLARRHSLVMDLKKRGWSVVPLDLGNQVRRFGRQAEIQFQTSAEALKLIGYRAIAFGADDLRLTSGELAAVAAGSDDRPSLFTSANTAVLAEDLTSSIQIIEVGDKKIGVTSVIGPSSLGKITNDEILRKPYDEGIRAALEKLKAAKCDWLVLLAQATIEESQKMAKDYPQFHIVVTAGGLAEPPYQPEPVAGAKSLFIEVGIKGMYVSVVGVFDDKKTPFRYQRVPLDDRFADSQEMLGMLASYQEQLKLLGLDGLGLKPVPHPSGRTFVGSEACGDCHSKAFEKFKETTHATSLNSLIRPGERSEIARNFDPECLSCHVTGWNPQKYHPYISGYLGLELTPAMVGNGCENCHGPGSAHVAAENGDGNPNDALKFKLRQQMRLTLKAAEQKCLECHDTDNSPEFQKPGAFQKYWEEIAHPGVD